MTGQSANPRPAHWWVRAMGADDIEVVSSIESTAYEFPWTAGNFRDSIQSGYDAWLFDSDDGVIGYAIVMWLPDEVHLLNLTVSPRWQGRGYGRQMLRWLCQDTRGRGAPSMMLEVRPSNRVARSLYESCAFEQIGLRKRYYPARGPFREDALVLRKEYSGE